MKQNMSEDLLIKYILKETAEAEGRDIEAWITGSNANAKKFEEVKLILEASNRLTQKSPLGQAEAWARFKELRTNKQSTAKVRSIIFLPVFRWLQTAAAVLILIGGVWLTYYFYNNRKPLPTEWITLKSVDSVRTHILPDGSIVYLNKNSSLAYTANFNSQRHLRLTGEAFFEVKHNEDAPFNVQTNNITITDIGTSFNIKSRMRVTEVIVESGIVKVIKNNASVNLNAHQKVDIGPEDNELKIINVKDQLYNYYRTGKFIASNTPLWRLVDVLNDAHGAHIQIRNNSLRNTPVTVTIKLEDSLSAVLNLLKATIPEMKVDKKESEIILY